MHCTLGDAANVWVLVSESVDIVMLPPSGAMHNRRVRDHPASPLAALKVVCDLDVLTKYSPDSER